MSVIKNMVQKEAAVFEQLKAQYEAMLEELPKGSLTVKKGVYYYLNSKEGEKMISKYVGKASPEIDKLREQIERRRHIEKMLRSVNRELKIADKVRACK